MGVKFRGSSRHVLGIPYECNMPHAGLIGPTPDPNNTEILRNYPNNYLNFPNKNLNPLEFRKETNHNSFALSVYFAEPQKVEPPKSLPAVWIRWRTQQPLELHNCFSVGKGNH